jgi:histidyl-tRNA synthetase
MYKRVPGTRDILPEEVYSWQWIEEIARRILRNYAYQEIRTPVIEEASLFSRGLGEFAEIVQKQMFLIKNKEDTYALRPEGTASIVRAYIENNLDKIKKFSKFYYFGPMFRLERPQKGRLRQFHHIGAEAIGSIDPNIDIEVISLADTLLRSWGVNGYQIQINTLGCPEDKKKLVQLLEKELKDEAPGLCQECQVRLNKNVLRILDCKNEACKQITAKLKLQDKHLCADCQEHFDEVKSGLDGLGVKYEVARHLVRGLDYYTRTVFEVKHGQLGAQDALGAGGRYDNLVEELGGPKVACVGFAFGVERLMLVTQPAAKTTGGLTAYLVTLGREAAREGRILLDQLRKNGIPCETDYEGKSLKGAMRAANELGVKLVLLLGEDELKKNVVMVKDMAAGSQEEVSRQELIEKLKEKLNKE